MAADLSTHTSAFIDVVSLRVRALICPGASVCLLKETVFRYFSASFEISQARVSLQIVSASSMKVIGKVYLPVTIAGTVSRCFYVVFNMNRSRHSWTWFSVSL